MRRKTKEKLGTLPSRRHRSGKLWTFIWRNFPVVSKGNLYGLLIRNHVTHLLIYRTMDKSDKAFNLPTGYNLPGQEYITNEEDKDKVLIDCITANPDDYTLDQMEDVVKGWIRHINKVLKADKTTVNFESIE